MEECYLPPHQHPLDWFAIPELKGENVSFLTYTKTGWVCRLCESDKFSNIDEHTTTAEHRVCHQALEQRRCELHTLVKQQEERLQLEYQAQEEEKSDLLHQQELQAEVQRQRVVEDEQARHKQAATERRANIKPSLRNVRVEEPVGVQNSSTHKIRQLRAQRLAQTTRSNKISAAPAPLLLSPKEQEKEAKRLQMLEITRRHQEQQEREEAMYQKQREEERLRREQALLRKREMEEQEMSLMECFGCMDFKENYSVPMDNVKSFWEKELFGL